MHYLLRYYKYLFIILYSLSFLLMPTKALSLDSPTHTLSFSVIKTAESNGTPEALIVSGGSWFTVRNLVHTAVLVRHPKGDFLWDSGIGIEVESQMEVLSLFESHVFSIKNVSPAREQLEGNGYPIQNLMAIIPSHMHWDHASGLEDFDNTPIWIPAESLLEARKGHPPGFIASQFDRQDLQWHNLKLQNNSFMEFDKSFDIYGDGSAVLVDLTGHTEGHLGLFISLENGKQYFFIGDATWALKGVIKNKPRPWIIDTLVGADSDAEKSLKVVSKIHQLKKQKPELYVVPAHDELQLQNLPNFPVFSE